MVKRGMKKGELFQDGEVWYRVTEVCDKTSYISEMVPDDEAEAELSAKVRKPKEPKEG